MDERIIIEENLGTLRSREAVFAVSVFGAGKHVSNLESIGIRLTR